MQTSKVPIEDLPKLVVYICQADQFNQTKAKSLGYGHIELFLNGMLNGTNTTSWHGKYGNLTHIELQSILFDYDYTKLELHKYGSSIEYIFMVPHGICIKIKEPNPTIYFESKQRVNIIYADPYRAMIFGLSNFLIQKDQLGLLLKNIMIKEPLK